VACAEAARRYKKETSVLIGLLEVIVDVDGMAVWSLDRYLFMHAMGVIRHFLGSVVFPLFSHDDVVQL
jgi:hypothetical protein